MASGNPKIKKALEQSDKLRLFLDYDGTLADFAPNPDVIEKNSTVIDLLKLLVTKKNIDVSIISGRRLSHLQKLIPITKGITIAGTYGLEIQMKNGEIYTPLDLETLRPQLDRLKKRWFALVQGKNGFYLEDKRWTLALHAKDAESQKAEEVLASAIEEAERLIDENVFQILPGHKFLEVSPVQAKKTDCVNYLISKFPMEDSVSIYLGDDDKDEEAFALIQSKGGFAIRVCSNVINNPIEDWRLDDPEAARNWLRSLYEEFT